VDEGGERGPERRLEALREERGHHPGQHVTGPTAPEGGSAGRVHE
jgi:hypothetical protein